MYKEIEANKRKTWFLVTTVSVLIVVLFYIGGLMMNVDIYASIIFGTIFSTVFSLISYYAGDKAVLITSGAKQITKQQAPDLWNIVENLTIAAGLPMPKVYVINDPSPNAFATGRDPEHASMAFTTGILRVLNKTELEGVAAHELSHIQNLDIRVMTITVILVGIVMLIADLLLRIGIHSDRKQGQAAIVFLIIGIAVAVLSPLIAQLIKLAISRAREYLADASASLLTRHPEGLASALEKIKENSLPLKKANHATAHLFISNPFGSKKAENSWFQRAFSTHPPIDERIQKLRTMGI
ncbi:MAG: M48 family metallopeptidase [Candidatus Uhrbacteria bacterium]|nr:M48 family metallopeptidase [Candidatus Uhrbacteria bacterium]